MKDILQKYSLLLLLILGGIFAPLSGVYANLATPIVLQPPLESINAPLPALISQSMAICGSEEVSVGYVLSGSEYKMKCMSIADIRSILGISAAPLACGAGKIAKGISGDGTVLQCRSLNPGCGLTQSMVDELNTYSVPFMITSSKTIDEWCNTTTLRLYDKGGEKIDPIDGKRHLPNGVRKLNRLTTLSIEGYPVEVVDPWIGNLAQLENLVIISPQLSSLPSSLGYLSNLKKLVISGFNISSSTTSTKAPITMLPDSIVNLTSLEKLAITKTNITQLPRNFERLNKLTSLSLQDNSLTSLPENIGDISMLVGTVNEPYVSGYSKYSLLSTCTNVYCFFGNSNTSGYYTGSLDISGNQLAYIPASISQLTNLVGINLSGNPLTGSGSTPALPNDFGNLVNMQEFVLDNTQIATLPESFSNLVNLHQIVITGNTQLKKLPRDFGMLSGLQRFHLQGNGLEELPESFGDLPEFVMNTPDVSSTSRYYTKDVLNLRNNQLTTLPRSITKFKNRGLKTLFLDGNRMKSFPSNIGDLDTLQNLFLPSNTMSGGLVTHIEKVKASYVNLTNNQLTELPDIFGSGSFTHLTGALDLSANSLSDLPPSFGQLSRLKTLNLSSNGFTIFPESLSDLVDLKELWIYGNSIEIVPSSIGKMKGLQTLKFSTISSPGYRIGNPITNIAEEIGDLVNLTIFEIANHKLESLPDSFDKLTQLTTLDLYSPYPHKIGTLGGVYGSNYNTLGIEYDITPTGKGVKIEGGRDRNYAPVLITVGLLACDLLTSEIQELNSLVGVDKNADEWCTGTTSINLSNKNLTVVPNGLAKLKSLKNINLSNNKLTSIPLFPAAEQLNVSQNKFSGFFGNKTYNTFMLTGAIKSLDISHNYITTLSLERTSINNLQANNNQLTSIDLTYAPLRTVNVAHNNISQFSLVTYFWDLKSYPASNIESLDLSHNSIASFVLTGSQTPKLKYLDLRSNTGAKSLSELYTSSGTAITQSEGLMTVNEETVTIKSFGDGSSIQIAVLPSYANECSITETDLQEIKNDTTRFYWYTDKSANWWCNQTKIDLASRGISAVPIWFGKLKNLKELDLGGNNLTALPASLSGLTSIERLSLRQNNFTLFPGVITTLTNLRELYIDNLDSGCPGGIEIISNLGRSVTCGVGSTNQITEIPYSIRNLTNLQKFELKRNEINDLGEGFVYLNLTGSLDLSYNQLQTLPDNFGNLTNITSLDLRNNKLTSFGLTFPHLTQLKALFIKGGDNKLGSLPDGFGSLTGLGCQNGNYLEKTLDLSDQALERLPDGFGQFPCIQTLDISGNNFNAPLPAGFGNMSELRYLYAQNTKRDSSGNSIGGITGVLPDSFTGMTKVYSVNLSGNEITGLGKFIKLTTGSFSLDISDNHIVSLPDDIGWRGINAIELHTNLFETLPDSFYRISQSTLKLDNNIHLTHLPESFSGMTSLTRLDINNTAIKYLPRDFHRLYRLVELNIIDGELEELPSSFGQLQQLEKLDLSGGNKIKYLPESFGNLSKLTSLNLYSNNLGEDITKEPIPDSFANLKITEILLGQNQLRTIPSSITTMNKVTKMDLGNNKLESLPEGLGNMTRLSQLNLANPLSSYSPTLSKLPNDFDQLSGRLTELKMNRTNLGNLSNDFSSSVPSSLSQASITNDESTITIGSAGDNGRISITKN